MIKQFFKRIFCKHQYNYIDNKLTDFGRFKTYSYRCEKCGKVIRERI